MQDVNFQEYASAIIKMGEQIPTEKQRIRELQQHRTKLTLELQQQEQIEIVSNLQSHEHIQITSNL